jgi:hypothetical protein
LISNNTIHQVDLECNGLILEKNTNKIVCMCTNKFIPLDLTSIELKETPDSIEYCEDGAVIRLYYYQNEWRTATTKCIDANTSYWGDTSFGELFWQLFNTTHLENLDKSCTYSFILIHQDNRNVIDHKENYLIYTSTINNVSLTETVDNIFNDPIIRNITKMEINTNSIINADCVNRQDNLPANADCIKGTLTSNNLTKKGLILRYNSQTYIYDFKYYTKLKNIRGNTPKLLDRYLELLDNQTKLDQFKKYYGKDSVFLFAMIQHCINNVYLDIHKLYISIYIKHLGKVSVDHILYKTIKQLHHIYHTENVIITLDQVIKKVNNLDLNIRRQLIKNYIGWV